jgi:hypothetical protein
MKMPPNSPDMDAARENLKAQYQKLEAYVLRQVDDLAKSGIAGQRLCAIARTDIERAFMALEKALMIGGPAGNDYAKVPSVDPFPQSFRPDLDRSPLHNVAPKPEIRDHRADGRNYDPDDAA